MWEVLVTHRRSGDLWVFLKPSVLRSGQQDGAHVEAGAARMWKHVCMLPFTQG